MSGADGGQSVAGPVEEESNFASDNVILLLRQTVARTALEITLRVQTATLILVSHTNHWFESIC